MVRAPNLPAPAAGRPTADRTTATAAAAGRPVSRSVAALASGVGRSQFGLATRKQLRDAGISDRTIRRRTAMGDWGRVGSRVIDLGSHEPSWEQGLMGALLAAGLGSSWASHATAAYLHGLLDQRRPDRYDILVPRGRRPEVAGTNVHAVRRLEPDELTRVGPFPVTSVARTLLDLAGDLEEAALEPIVWEAARNDRSQVRQLVDLGMRHPRARGRAAVSRILRGMHPQVEAIESPLEVFGLVALRSLGVPWPELQVVIRDEAGRFVARVDAAWPHARLIVEFDGGAYHQTPRQRAADGRRRERLTSLAWHVVVLRQRDLSGSRLQQVGEELRARLRSS
jgi:hypothetical protein